MFLNQSAGIHCRCIGEWCIFYTSTVNIPVGMALEDFNLRYLLAIIYTNNILIQRRRWRYKMFIYLILMIIPFMASIGVIYTLFSLGNIAMGYIYGPVVYALWMIEYPFVNWNIHSLQYWYRLYVMQNLVHLLLRSLLLNWYSFCRSLPIYGYNPWTEVESNGSLTEIMVYFEHHSAPSKSW